ncbi:MAG: hypothetical protein KDC95_12930 [Planctomycetes bacterium]|nr:hypothetical protein [Planctomycetota bacterium]
MTEQVLETNRSLPMRTIILLALALPLPAQTVLKVESATPLSVLASQAGLTGNSATWPAQLDLGRSFSLQAFYWSYDIYWSRLEARIDPLQLTLTDSAGQGRPTSLDLACREGQHDFLLSISHPTTRTVRFFVKHDLMGKVWDRETRVDIGNDNSWEYSGKIQNTNGTLPFWSRLVTIGPTPLQIRIRTYTSWAYYGGTIAATFGIDRAKPCQWTVLSLPCGSVRISDPSLLDLDTLLLGQSAGQPNTVGALLIGRDRIAVPLPGLSGCVLRTTPLIALWYQSDPLGTAMLTLPIPKSLPVAANLQLVSLTQKNNQLDIEASSANALLCQ